MLVRIDPTSELPLFEQVAASVRSDLARGSLAAGDRLPAARDLAEALDINMHTVLRAYSTLREEGLIDLRRGRGAVVTAAAESWSGLATDVKALVAKARSLGIDPGVLATLVKEFSHG